MKRWFIGAVLSLFSWVALADRLPVVASFSIIANMTREIGGERVDVFSLVGPEQDVHVYQPTPADIQRLSQAKVFVINGLGLEGWLARLSQSVNFSGVQIEATSGVVPLHEEGFHHSHHHDTEDDDDIDPHAWHDPYCVLIYINNIAKGLIKADPAGKAWYQKRAADFSLRVMKLGRWATGAFAAIPEARRKVITAHDAFGYLGHRYRIHFLAPQGMSTEAEASAKDVAQLVRQLRRERVKTIFFETMADKRLLQQIANEAGVRIGGQLYSDALSKSGGVADSWEKMFRYNVETLLAALN